MITYCKLTIFHRKDIKKKQKNIVGYFLEQIPMLPAGCMGLFHWGICVQLIWK